MVLQSIVLYSALILLMILLAKLYSLKQSYSVLGKSEIVGTGTGIVYLVLIMLSFSIMMGLRYDVGTDYLAYQEGYIYNYDVGKGEVLFNWIRELFNKVEFHYVKYPHLLGQLSC